MNDDAPSADNSFKLLADHILRLEFNWFQPGRRYMKLLTRLALSRAEYEQIDKHIATVWGA